MSNLDKYNKTPSGSFAQPALRGVPVVVKLVSLFGGWLQTFGWIWLGFSLVFMWFMIPATDVSSFWKFSGELVTVTGKVTGAEKTGISEGGSDSSPGTPIWKVSYSYADSSGRVREGVSYTVGSMWGVGDTPPVEYRTDDTSISRIQGARTSPLPPWVLIFLLFPLIGVVMVLFGLRAGVKRSSLLAAGKLARGKLVSKTPTNTKVNNRTVYKPDYEFEADDGSKHVATARTHDTARLEDEEAELVLYHPKDADRNWVVDSLPAGITLDETGRYAPPSAMMSLLILLPPALTIFGHGIALLVVLTK